MNTGHWMRTLASVGLGLCWLTMSAASQATDNFTAVTAADKPAKAQKPKQSKASKAERDKRLLRECRGKANAGACEGYAS